MARINKDLSLSLSLVTFVTCFVECGFLSVLYYPRFLLSVIVV